MKSKGNGSKIKDVPGALDVVGTDGRVEIAKAEASAHERTIGRSAPRTLAT
jgi:hypothetical protein